jgi:hypothetical protein
MLIGMAFTAGKYTSVLHIKAAQPGNIWPNHQFWLFKKCIKTTAKHLLQQFSSS